LSISLADLRVPLVWVEQVDSHPSFSPADLCPAWRSRGRGPGYSMRRLPRGPTGARAPAGSRVCGGRISGGSFLRKKRAAEVTLCSDRRFFFYIGLHFSTLPFGRGGGRSGGRWGGHSGGRSGGRWGGRSGGRWGGRGALFDPGWFHGGLDGSRGSGVWVILLIGTLLSRHFDLKEKKIWCEKIFLPNNFNNHFLFTNVLKIYFKKM